MSPAGMTPAPPDAESGDLVGRLARLGQAYDAEPAFPVKSLELLRAEGLHGRFAPTAAGGHAFADPLTQALDLFGALRGVGRGDLSVGRLFEGHVNALALFDALATPAQIAWLSDALAAGAWFGCWATEPPPGVALVSDGDQARLVGAKVFASGAGRLDYALVTVRPSVGDRLIVVAPAADPTRADLSGWRVRGMRASQSGRYDLTDLPVRPEHIPGSRS